MYTLQYSPVFTCWIITRESDGAIVARIRARHKALAKLDELNGKGN